MRPVVVVVGLDFEDARRFVLKHRDERPQLREARLVSADHGTQHVLGLEVGRVHETPAARLGKHYDAVLTALRAASNRYAKPLT